MSEWCVQCRLIAAVVMSRWCAAADLSLSLWSSRCARPPAVPVVASLLLAVAVLSHSTPTEMRSIVANNTVRQHNEQAAWMGRREPAAAQQRETARPLCR